MKGIPMMRKRKKDEGNEDDLEASETVHLHHLAARGSLKKMNIYKILNLFRFPHFTSCSLQCNFPISTLSMPGARFLYRQR